MMTATQTGSGPLTVIERLQAAINRHDLDAMVACFAPEYVGTFPAHPDRVAHGPAGVRENWSQIFGLVPDLKADILGSAEEGGIVWTEWQWTGTRRDGATSVMC